LVDGGVELLGDSAIGQGGGLVREELKNFDWHGYGLGISDLNYTISIVQNVLEERKQLVEERWARLREESPDIADDIMDDVAYYTWVENQYLWTFCLWRLQAIFEGILTKDILQDVGRLPGLRAKLAAVSRAGYSVDTELERELIEWAELRNALSHCPPEQFRPACLEEGDLLEYRDLLVGVLGAWRDEGAEIRD